jgi:CheY-like chemotaxis protein
LGCKEDAVDIDKKTILVVDDDEDMRTQIGIVAKQEYNVDFAISGEEALYKLSINHYDGIVMDVMMDTLSDGLDTAKIIKENPATKTIPVIMLTGVNQHFDYRSQIDGDFFPKDKWLSKPVDPKRLLEEIKTIVQ